MDHIRKLVQEYVGLLKGHNVIHYFLIVSALIPQLLKIIGIRQKPDVKNQIRVLGDPVFEAKGNHRHEEILIIFVIDKNPL